MWAIFQLQDLMGTNEKLRRENPHEERINVPAIPKHFWRYRMHITLEQLLKEKEFNEELKQQLIDAGRVVVKQEVKKKKALAREKVS
jgi:4-alpha-glucanotransferase